MQPRESLNFEAAMQRKNRPMKRQYTTAAAMVMAAMVMTACGSSPTAPSTPKAPPVPSYAGNWSGNYTITGCTETGGMALANLCSAMGQSAPYSMNLQQSATSVTGSFMLGKVNFPSTGGTVQTDGSLGLQATSVDSGITIVVTWALRNPGGANPTINGTITQAWTHNTLSGDIKIAGTISSSIHGDMASLQSLAPGVPATAPEGPVTLEQFVERMKKR